MEIKCPNCGKMLEGQDDLAGKTVGCPGCDRSFRVQVTPNPGRAPAPRAVPDAAALRHPKEKAAFNWLVFFSAVLWAGLAVWAVFGGIFFHSRNYFVQMAGGDALPGAHKDPRD